MKKDRQYLKKQFETGKSSNVTVKTTILKVKITTLPLKTAIINAPVHCGPKFKGLTIAFSYCAITVFISDERRGSFKTI